MADQPRPSLDLPGHRAVAAVHFLFHLGILTVATPCARAADATPPPAPAAAVSPWEIYRLFEHHCVDCHGGHLAKPKGKFGYILDLRRLATEKKITPGDPDHSDLYLALIADDPDEQMPPPDSDAPKLSAKEIASVRDWIAGGALVDPTPPVPVETPPAPVDETKRSPEEKPPPSVSQIVGRLHPMVVHFPIALLLASCLAEIASRLRPATAWLRGAVRGGLWTGCAGALVAAGCGWLNALHEGYRAGTVDAHRWLGLATAGAALLAVVAHELAWRREPAGSRSVLRWSSLVLLLAAGALVALAGHTGGLIAYGKDYLWGF